MRQSEQWCHIVSPSSRKFKTTISAKKYHGIGVLGSQRNHIDWIFTSGGNHQCSEVLWNPKKLRRAFQNKRRCVLTSGICLLHDNARSHTVNDKKQFLESFGFDALNHSPYFPDRVLSDYRWFTSLKKHMAGKKYSIDEDVKRVDKAGGGRVLRGKYQIINLPSHNPYWRRRRLCRKIAHKYINVTAYVFLFNALFCTLQKLSALSLWTCLAYN